FSDGLSGQDPFERLLELIFDDRISRFSPAAPTAVHRNDVAVAHFLKIVSSEGGAIPASAVENDFGIFVGDGLFDIAFNDSFAQMNSAGDMPARPFALFASVHQD